MASFHETENFNPQTEPAKADDNVNESLTYIELLRRGRGGYGEPPSSDRCLSGGGRLLRLPEVLRIYPVSRSTWYAGIKGGIYPEPVRLSSRVVAWYEDDIMNLARRSGRTG